MKKILRLAFLRVYRRLFGRPGDWMTPAPAAAATEAKDTASRTSPGGLDYNPDAEFDKLKEPVESPVHRLLRGLKDGTADIEIAHVFEARVDDEGRLIPERLLRESGGLRERRYNVRRVEGRGEFLRLFESANLVFEKLPVKAREARKAKSRALAAVREAMRSRQLREDFIDQTSITDEITTTYDRSQFTEYTPIMGGPFYRQLYMFDHLRMIAVSFEAYHHNPYAHRIVNVFCELTHGRGFQLSSRDPEYLEQVEEVVRQLDLRRLVFEWRRERLIYGELLLDNRKWQSIDPSTVWDIITEPDDITKPLYYFQSYPTAYQTFTGYRVPGVQDSEKAAPMKYIVRQLPFDQVLHFKSECVTNEKRGRSVLFPILGWLKRHRDTANAVAVRLQLEASFIFDDTIEGSEQDVLDHLTRFSGMPVAGSVFAHTAGVKRAAMPVMAQAATGAFREALQEFVCIMASSVGLPKEYMNITGRSGGRAGALVGVEPVNKVVERYQLEDAEVIHSVLKIELPRRGIVYDRRMIEVIFPSVTKDVTSEVIKNVQAAEAQGYISKRTAGKMAATELNIPSYDYDEEQKQMLEDKAAGLDQVGDVPAPASRFGGGQPAAGGDAGGSDVHGDGAAELKDQLTTL